MKLLLVILDCLFVFFCWASALGVFIRAPWKIALASRDPETATVGPFLYRSIVGWMIWLGCLGVALWFGAQWVGLMVIVGLGGLLFFGQYFRKQIHPKLKQLHTSDQ